MPYVSNWFLGISLVLLFYSDGSYSGSAGDIDPPGPGKPRGRPLGADRGAAPAPIPDVDPMQGDER